MNVIITIKDREAVPVRAIPFLTDWELMSPDVVADALTGEDEFNPQFKELRAYRFDGDAIKAVNPTWWANFPARELKALSDRIKHVEITHETGLGEWRRQSLPVLPAGVFVWRDEFEECFWRRFGPDGETVLSLTERGELESQRSNESIQLDYDPFIPDEEIIKLVMEGFAAKPPLAPSRTSRGVASGGASAKTVVSEFSEAVKAGREVASEVASAKTIDFPAGTEHVPFGGLARLIADVLHPEGQTDASAIRNRAAREELRRQLHRAVKTGELPVKSPLTLLPPMDSPIGEALNRALVSVADLSRFVSVMGLKVEMEQTEPQAKAPAVGASGGKVWTDERKAEVRAYREKHGLKKTAEHYGVSQATISKHVPANKAKLTGYSAFNYRQK